jgi:hypothetical protein
MYQEKAEETVEKLCEEIKRIVDKGNADQYKDYLPNLVKATADLIAVVK